jgi:CPA2 family monovalent cation:H+ antiporter-2
MENLQLVLDLVLAVLAAFVGGIVAQRLGQPVILGYLLAGVVIGPFTPGPTADVHSVQVLAEIGVAFLMFALGAEVSLGELRQFGRVTLLGGALQLLLTMGLGPLLAPLLGLSILQGVFLGALLALSSTVVALKVLMARGELQALHGRVALGILIVQDLAVVPMVVVLPTLVVGGEGVVVELAFAAAKAAAVLLVAYLLGARAVPRLLGHAAGTRSREVFLLGIVSLALGTALATQAAGLSLALGAFLAGLVVAESEYRTQVVAEILPLRDLFASLFFVSVGMLINLPSLVTQAGAVLLLSATTVIGKVVIVTLVVLVLGMPGRVALLSGLSLAQVGEFSFVLARLGADAGAIPSVLFDLTLATALVTIVLTPLVLWSAPFLLRVLERLPLVGKRFAPPLEADAGADGLSRHAVICGYGRVGRELADALDRRKLRYLVVEYNPRIVQQLRARNVPVIYGDAANPVVLEHAHLETARLLAVLMPDAHAAELTTAHARASFPQLDVIARAVSTEHIEGLRRAGATEVVQPEFEAGLEVIRHTMRRYGIVGMELTHLMAGRRTAFYRRAGQPGDGFPSSSGPLDLRRTRRER